jgi:LmbE family N-acetylglucosaminyl deacetylase
MAIHNSWPKLIGKPAGEKVLVLAPHMDDEIIGCAGVIRKHTESGHPVVVIYMTDGSKGMMGKAANPGLMDIRKRESEKSNRWLGIRETYYFDLEDGSDKPWDHMSGILREVLESQQPDIIYLPSFWDTHPDHQKTNQLFKQATLGRLSCQVCAYEVWSPINPNILVNITRQMPLKLKAIREHQSQLRYLRYDRMILSLNHYRANFIPFPGMRFAEAFYMTECQNYLALLTRFTLSDMNWKALGV